MKSKTKNKPIIPEEGFIISEVVDSLQRAGLYDATAQQLRKNEKVGLFKPFQGTDNKYRFYTNEVIERIKLVYILKSVGFSLQKIKTFLDLREEIEDNPSLEVHKAFNEETGETRFSRKLSVEAGKDSVSYQRFLNLKQRYGSMCDEIKEKLEKNKKIAEDGIQKIDRVKLSVQKLGEE